MEERLKERINSEKARLAVLEGKVKRCKETITGLESALREQRFSAAEQAISVTGLTLEEIIAAVERGDFTPLQKKIIRWDHQETGIAPVATPQQEQPGDATPEGE